jgi:hypothetical protein
METTGNLIEDRNELEGADDPTTAERDELMLDELRQAIRRKLPPLE